jgi:hypothetical protein
MSGLDKLRTELGALVANIVLTSPHRAEIMAGASAGQTIMIAGRNGPHAGLAAALYPWYCGWSPPGAAAGTDTSAAFLAELRSANPLAPRSVGGWSIVAMDATGLIVINELGEQRRVPPSDLLVPSSGIALGSPVRLMVPRERLTGPTGHYMILGGPIHSHCTGRQVRFYWNISTAGAPQFLGTICKRLVQRRIPFEAKVPANEQGYNRSDAGVLYINIEHIEVARDIIETGQKELAPWLREDTPLFTQRLSPGLAFAETPPENGSFGLHRCTLIAEGLADAYRQGLTSQPDLVEFLCMHLARYGLDLSRPARNPGTAYPYRLPGTSVT